MSEALIIILALIASGGLYLGLGLRQNHRIRAPGDLIPVRRSGEASVHNATEFSASTVAATVSLATVVLALFELAPYMGSWLLWTVVTTALGLLVVRLLARRVLQRLDAQGDTLPSLHQFLGNVYGSRRLTVIAATCTSLGFLGAFATELSVGSRFLGGLIPSIPLWATATTLAAIGLTYTYLGGFRTVIVTDRLQMTGIWLLIVALAAYYLASMSSSPSVGAALERIPSDVFDFSGREGLVAFMLGIFVINVPTFLADMSVWQRIAGARNPTTTLRGLTRSVMSVSATWGALALLACLLPAVLTLTGDTTPLIQLMQQISGTPGVVSGVVLFVVVLGLFAAMLSTASTQLIAISHTIYADMLDARVQEAQSDARQLWHARSVLILAGVIALVLVESLRLAGFSIADLVFAIYGAQLGLVPAVVLALFVGRSQLSRLRGAATAAVAVGFLGGWGAAIYGKIAGDQDLVFLAPVVSLTASTAILSLAAALRLTNWQRSVGE